MTLVKKCRHDQLAQRHCGCAWYADHYVDGKRVYTNLGSDYADALVKNAELEASKIRSRTGMLAARDGSFRHIAARWMDVKRIEGVRERTIKAYGNHIKLLSEWFGDLHVSKITKADSMELVETLKENHAPRYAQQIWSIYKSVLTYAQDHELLGVLPLPRAGKKLFPQHSVEDKEIDLDLIEATIVALPPEFRPLAEVVFLTGMRIGEALGLTVEDFHVDRLTVSKQWQDSLGIVPPKTRRSNRVVALSPRAIRILEEVTEGRSNSERIFPYKYGLCYYELSKVSDKVTWHTFRHANATLRAKAAQDPRVQQTQLGHSQMTQTMAYGLQSENLGSAADLDAAR